MEPLHRPAARVTGATKRRSQMSFDGPTGAVQVVGGHHHMVDGKQSAAEHRQILKAISSGDPEAAGRALPSFADRPAFIGWGLKDLVFDRHFLERFRADLPRAEVHAFEDAGHYVLEDRHEVLVPAIRAFLDAHPAG